MFSGNVVLFMGTLKLEFPILPRQGGLWFVSLPHRCLSWVPFVSLYVDWKETHNTIRFPLFQCFHLQRLEKRNTEVLWIWIAYPPRETGTACCQRCLQVYSSWYQNPILSYKELQSLKPKFACTYVKKLPPAQGTNPGRSIR